MSVNIGHGDRRVIDAITAQATKLQFVQPAFATEIRARLGAKLAEILPGDMDKVFFTLGGAEAIENAIKLARHATGRHKILARYRAYHGATLGAMTLTGDPRRWANEPGIVGVVRYPDTHRWGEAEPRPVAESLQGLEDVIRYEGANSIAAVFLETIVGTNGILIPPDGYIQGVREICDRNDILMVADEVMAGFGRTGRWFAVDHWDVTPDLMTMAKGLTSSYLPLGAVGDAPRDRREVRDPDVLRRADLQQPPGQPRRLAGDDLGLRGGRPHRERRPARRRSCASTIERLAEKHPSVGATRNLGLFGIIDLVRTRDPWTPLTPFNGTSDEMKAIGKFFRKNGLYTMIAEQLDPHQPAAVHHRGAAGRGLRDHRPGPRHRRPGGHWLSDGDDRPSPAPAVDPDRVGGRRRLLPAANTSRRACSWRPRSPSSRTMLAMSGELRQHPRSMSTARSSSRRPGSWHRPGAQAGISMKAAPRRNSLSGIARSSRAGRRLHRDAGLRPVDAMDPGRLLDDLAVLIGLRVLADSQTLPARPVRRTRSRPRPVRPRRSPCPTPRRCAPRRSLRQVGDRRDEAMADASDPSIVLPR